MFFINHRARRLHLAAEKIVEADRKAMLLAVELGKNFVARRVNSVFALRRKKAGRAE
ncbi:hypothetical protein [Candidatus Erwinia dacicola]|uniref:Uncharacterized protein n=1 Tax=Candidatus Erwinia dacicola TaxID=252393 RepID=A0A328TS03_9GAMM|nr:hypothetical protein [Candidatus Erwinia dacicola]RAP72332.1 hypothetical protein ACZ87_00838 [Candidatus Erwinia dacicola]